jgi:hypothetical protein
MCCSALNAILSVGYISSEMTAVFMCLVQSKSPILAIGSHKFAQVRQNPEFAEPRTDPGVRFGSGSGSASVQNRTPATLALLWALFDAASPAQLTVLALGGIRDGDENSMSILQK